ncbi:PcfK-like family protein [uncultured Phocaeicola sp.]|uniref:PcfK-like family protein n=1 Tax=uncultured Phocaeicola sp. TaxID=990718 RepID=UPI00262D90B3|nr:PcfK-like family protein [uncultured Phocaeicola sp.]
MKTTDHFKRTIQMYLEQRAAEDSLFAKNYRNPAKNIDDCVTYILNYVQKSGCNGFTDGEIYGQAVHYYDENEIEVGEPINCQVAVNHVVELTAEEKAEARQNAIRQYQDGLMREMQNRHKPRTATNATTQPIQQPSLFDLGL